PCGGCLLFFPDRSPQFPRRSVHPLKAGLPATSSLSGMPTEHAPTSMTEHPGDAGLTGISDCWGDVGSAGMAHGYHHGNLRAAALERAARSIAEQRPQELSMRALAADMGVDLTG